MAGNVSVGPKRTPGHPLTRSLNARALSLKACAGALFSSLWGLAPCSARHRLSWAQGRSTSNYISETPHQVPTLSDLLSTSGHLTVTFLLCPISFIFNLYVEAP